MATFHATRCPESTRADSSTTRSPTSSPKAATTGSSRWAICSTCIGFETFLAYYDRFFDRVKDTAPVPGNHETYTLYMQGYLDYFGKVVHPPRGYYSYDLGAWHLIALNSQLCKGDGTTWYPELGQGTPVLRNEEAGGCRPETLSTNG